ncbi:MAG: hypothetical protein ACXW2U_06785 [Telluria sp.]
MLPKPASCTGVRTPALIICAALVLAACGGGGGNPNAVGGNPNLNPNPGAGTTAPVAQPTLELSFVNASGLGTNTLSAGAPLTARALVRDRAGMPLPDALVTFTTDASLAVLTPSAGTRLTGSDGVASIVMTPASLVAGGAARLTVTATVDGVTLSTERNYAVNATALAMGAITLSPATIAAWNDTRVSVPVLANGVRYTGPALAVKFSSPCVASGKASMAASAPTNNGVAEVVYRDQGCQGSDLITASVDDVQLPATRALTIEAPAPASVQFVSATPVNQSIVIKGQGGNLRTETASLRFKVFDIANRALPGQLVSFAVTPAGTEVQLNAGQDRVFTDQNGEAVTTVNSGTKATTFRVRATLPNGVSTLSDSIVVTTGLPVQRAFSLSVGSPNVEGLNIDSTPSSPATGISVLVADEFGNPVADGTPVVFQSNMGSVGSSSMGGCNLVNGGCSVDFRTQNPRVAVPGVPATPCNTGPGSSADSPRAGLASICASTTDGANTVFARTFIFFSGGEAANVYLDNAAAPLARTGTAKSLGSIRSGDVKQVLLKLNDINNNPLPAGTTVQVTGLSNAATVEVAPDVVPNIFPSAAALLGGAAPQGSSHSLKVRAAGATPCVAGTIAGFSVTITSPRGKVITSYPFTMAITCP